MLISLRSDHKEHLNILTSQSAPVIADFCKLAIDFLQNGPNLKRYTVAAQKLEVDVDIIQNCIYGLINLLIISCKHQLSDADFRDSVLTLGFSQEQQLVLSKFYDSKRNEILQIISKLGVNEPHYHDLQWRFEVQVSSRSLLEQATPIVTMDLSLKTEKDDGRIEMENILFQTDPTNLMHMATELEKALIESRSRHSRKIQKALLNN